MGRRRTLPPDSRSREGAWRRLSEEEPQALPLRPRDRRRLRLEVLWRRSAGEALAGRAAEVSARRGTLEVVFSDARWAQEAAGAVVEAAGRLSAAAPDLKLRRVRIRAHGGAVLTRDIPAGPPRSEPRAARSQARGDGSATSGGGSAPSIEALAERYLRKARERFPAR